MEDVPLASFRRVELAFANGLLEEWGHLMGPNRRPQFRATQAHVLFHGEHPQAVTTTDALIAPRVGGARWLTRDNCIELSRLCAVRKDLCRVALRLWREYVFPLQGKEWAMSYQDMDAHTGNTYRFDGWTCVAVKQGQRKGVDTRSGRPNRIKKVWVWPPAKDRRAE